MSQSNSQTSSSCVWYREIAWIAHVQVKILQSISETLSCMHTVRSWGTMKAPKRVLPPSFQPCIFNFLLILTLFKPHGGVKPSWNLIIRKACETLTRKQMKERPRLLYFSSLFLFIFSHFCCWHPHLNWFKAVQMQVSGFWFSPELRLRIKWTIKYIFLFLKL